TKPGGRAAGGEVPVATVRGGHDDAAACAAGAREGGCRLGRQREGRRLPGRAPRKPEKLEDARPQRAVHRGRDGGGEPRPTPRSLDVAAPDAEQRAGGETKHGAEAAQPAPRELRDRPGDRAHPARARLGAEHLAEEAGLATGLRIVASIQRGGEEVVEL